MFTGAKTFFKNMQNQAETWKCDIFTLQSLIFLKMICKKRFISCKIWSPLFYRTVFNLWWLPFLWFCKVWRNLFGFLELGGQSNSECLAWKFFRLNFSSKGLKKHNLKIFQFSSRCQHKDSKFCVLGFIQRWN